MAGPPIQTFQSTVIGELPEESEDLLQQVDSDDIPSSPMDTEPFFHHLLKRMNPSECFSPATDALKACSAVAYKSCVSSDREELESLLTEMLKDIRGAHKARGSALHRLYRLTDREHAHNR